MAGITLTGLFTEIADAIREKKGTVGTIKAENFPDEIESIQTGITPTGTKYITDNQVTDVTNFANAQVQDSDLVAANIITGKNILGVQGSAVVPSGSQNITENGTYDITTKASVVVNVESESKRVANAPVEVVIQHNQYVTLTVTIASNGDLSVAQTAGSGTTRNLALDKTKVNWSGHEYVNATWDGDSHPNIELTYTVVSGEIEVTPLSVTENGTYTAPDGTAYSPVTVNVSGGGGKEKYVYHGYKEVAKTSLSTTGVTVTVQSAGNYKISWAAARSSSSGTMSTRLYVNGQAKDTDRTTWTRTYGQFITINSFALKANDKVEIYARSGSTSRQCMVGNLIVEEL